MRISDWSSDVCSSDLTGVSITFIAPTSSLATVLPIALIRYLCLIPDHLVNYRLFATLPRGRNLLDIGQHPERIEILANRMQLPVEIGRASCRGSVCPSV